jgi:hypothetical protein
MPGRPRPAGHPQAADRALSRRASHVYATGPDAPDQAAAGVRTVLTTWQMPEPLIEYLTAAARDLVADAVSQAPAPTVTVFTVQDQQRAAVHALSSACAQQHPGGLIDPFTVEALHALHARHGVATRQAGCLCTALAWRHDRRVFITAPSLTPACPPSRPGTQAPARRAVPAGHS